MNIYSANKVITRDRAPANFLSISDFRMSESVDLSVSISTAYEDATQTRLKLNPFNQVLCYIIANIRESNQAEANR